MSKILLVDDDKIILKVLSKLIKEKIGVETKNVESLEELKKVLKIDNYWLSICDYHLPDAEKGEAIDILINNKIPTIVLTASYDEKLRKEILEKGVVDYLVKGIPDIMNHVISTIARALKNMKTKVLLIEDTQTDRLIMRSILENMLFKVFEAENGLEALGILDKHPEVRLIILDYYLPEEDTLELIYSIRKKFKKNEVGIIVVSGIIEMHLIPILLKAGANDFLRKPFSKEEFMVRINNTMEMLDLIKDLEFYAFRDPLTGLYNRRYFFENASILWKYAMRNQTNLACIIIDVDDFKKINDIYGHEVGDEVLKDLAKQLKKFFERESDIVARIGGEEFALIVAYESEKALLAHLERLRNNIENNVLKILEGEKEIRIKYTISAGVELELKDSLKEMLTSADKKLYNSKTKGKNCITY